MSTLKLTAKLPKFLPTGEMVGWSLRPKAIFVTAARPLQCKKFDDSPEKVKEAADSIKNAADSVSQSVKKVSEKVSETSDVVKEKAGEMMTLGAAKIATEVIKKKDEMKKEEKKKKK